MSENEKYCEGIAIWLARMERFFRAIARRGTDDPWYDDAADILNRIEQFRRIPESGDAWMIAGNFAELQSRVGDLRLKADTDRQRDWVTAIVEGIARALPQARFSTWQGHGHFMVFEDSPRAGKIIREWLATS